MTDNLAPIPFDLIGTTALVTGSAGGMGRAITAALSAAGATTVYGWDRVPTEADHVVSQIVDLGDADDVAAAVAALETTPEIVVNAAGFQASRDGLNIATDDFARTIQINLISPFIIQRDVAKRLAAESKEGAFVNISSVAGKHGFGNQADYTTSKAGLIGLTRAAALDLAPAITVNGIAPGTVDTPMIANVIAEVAGHTGLSLEDQRRDFESRIPLQRMQQPNEIAAAIVFLASVAARSITGEVLNVDGGSTRD